MKSPAPERGILLIEDSEDDAFFFERAAKKSGVPFSLRWIASGAEAIEYLKNFVQGKATDDSAPPDLIFLDLKMGGISGFDVLRWIKKTSFIPTLEVIVLSGSQQEADIQLARELGAADYIVKPIAPDELKARLSAQRRDATSSLAQF